MSGWISPTGASGWVNSDYARDGDLGTEAYMDVPPYEWGAFLILTHASFYCTKVRYHVSDNTTAICSIDVDVYYSGGWHHLYEGGYTEDIWIEKTLASGQFVTQARVRFYCDKATSGRFFVHEVEFYQITIPTAPSGCAAQYVATNKSKCTWNDNSNNETGFHLQVDINDAGFAVWKDVGANVEDSGNHTTGADKKIRFRVQAYNAAGSSAWSTSGCVHTTPSIPTGLSADWLVQYETVRLTYTKNQTYGDIDIFSQVDVGGFSHLAYDNVSPYDDTTPTGESYKYEYKIRARSPQNDDSSYTYSAFTSIVTIYSTVTLSESISLLESLPTIERKLALEEAIALKDISDVPACADVVLEEALALAESFLASEQTIVRVTPSADFLAEQAKRSNQPAKRIWLYINNSLYDITDKFMSMGSIDRKMTYKPGETKLLTISDQDLVMSNADKYFSDLNPTSPFYDRDYAGADQVKVYAGFIIPSTGYAEVLQKADMKLIAIELMTKEGHAHLRCQDSFREVFDTYVGMPASDGTPNPLTYTDKTFKYIMDDLLINKAGIPSAKVDIEDVTLTFSSISFEKKKVVECVQKLSEVARGNTVVLGDGTVQFRRFISEITDVDLVLQSGENYSSLRYIGQDFTLKVNKVVVIGATGVYAEAEASGETGVTLKYENDAIETDEVAADVAKECLGRFAVHPALVEITGEYLPSLDLKSVVKVYEPNSMMNPAIMQIRELALDIVGHTTRMVLLIPRSAKTWSTKPDWDSGTLDKLYCPINLEQLELEYDELSGTAEFIFDAEVTANWLSFDYTKENAKTIWRDDFRADSISKYTWHNFPGWNDGSPVMPTYDSVNKRLNINTGGDKGTTLEIPGLSIKNAKASFEVYIYGYYPTNAACANWLRFANGDNNYHAAHQSTAAEIYYASWLGKWVGDVITGLAEGTRFPKNNWRTLVFEINESNLKGYTDEYSMSATDGTFTTANKVLMGCFQTKGYIRAVLVEHYSLPSPVQCSITFQFATSDNGTDWSAWTNIIANCADSRYIKVKVSMSRTNFLSSAMPVLEDMTVGYFLKG